jgi:AraC-like DNA-binding protein
MAGLIASLNFYHYTWLISFWQSFVVLCLLSFVVLFRPDILYEYSFIKISPFTSEGSKQLVLSDKVFLQTKAGIQSFIEGEYFLRKNIKLAEIAEELEIQAYILSAYINQVYKMRFNDFINLHRIKYITDGITDGQWSHLTLEAIAEQAGFNNRTTFLNAFKKFVGMTPTEFLHEQKNGIGAIKPFRDNDHQTGSVD